MAGFLVAATIFVLTPAGAFSRHEWQRFAKLRMRVERLERNLWQETTQINRRFDRVCWDSDEYGRQALAYRGKTYRTCGPEFVGFADSRTIPIPAP